VVDDSLRRCELWLVHAAHQQSDHPPLQVVWQACLSPLCWARLPVSCGNRGAGVPHWQTLWLAYLAPLCLLCVCVHLGPCPRGMTRTAPAAGGSPTQQIHARAGARVGAAAGGGEAHQPCWCGRGGRSSCVGCCAAISCLTTACGHFKWGRVAARMSAWRVCCFKLPVKNCWMLTLVCACARVAHTSRGMLACERPVSFPAADVRAVSCRSWGCRLCVVCVAWKHCSCRALHCVHVASTHATQCRVELFCVVSR
jgi:hypothetical protein